MAVVAVVAKPAAIGLVGEVGTRLALPRLVEQSPVLSSSLQKGLRAEGAALYEVWARHRVAGRQLVVGVDIVEVDERVLDRHLNDLIRSGREMHHGRAEQFQRATNWSEKQPVSTL